MNIKIQAVDIVAKSEPRNRRKKKQGSGNEDIIPITISERLIANFDLTIGRKVVIEGQFRSYNSYENEKNRLVLTVFAKDIIDYKEE